MAHPDEADRLVPNSNPENRPTPPSKPPITEEMRANARANPNTWLYVFDEAFDPRGTVPTWGIVGAYPVNAAGEVVEDFHPNNQYKPSPRALGYPEPTSELERLLQYVRARHRPSSDLPRAIVKATLWVYAVAPSQRTLTGFHDRTGRVVVPAYTAKRLAPREWPHSRPVLGRDLVPLLAGHPLAINPDGAVTAVVPAERLVEALGEAH